MRLYFTDAMADESNTFPAGIQIEFNEILGGLKETWFKMIKILIGTPAVTTVIEKWITRRQVKL